MNRWRYATGTRLLFILAGLSVAACSGEHERTELPPRPIAWALVQAPESNPQHLAHGWVRAVHRAEIAFEVSGEIAGVHLRVGDRFEAGDVLAALDSEPFELEIAHARAGLARAQAGWLDARSRWWRLAALATTTADVPADLEQAANQLQEAKGKVEQYSALLALARRKLEDSKLRAPYAGHVARRHIQPAESVVQGRPAFKLVGANGHEVAVHVSRNIARRIDHDAEHPVTLPEIDKPLLARVVEVGPMATSAGVYPVTLELVAPPPSIRPGQSAEVRLQLGPTGTHPDGMPVLSVPVSAIRAVSEDKAEVYVYDPTDDLVAPRPVELVQLNGHNALVTGPLKPGDVVAAQGVDFLKPGQRVSLLGKGVARYNP